MVLVSGKSGKIIISKFRKKGVFTNISKKFNELNWQKKEKRHCTRFCTAVLYVFEAEVLFQTAEFLQKIDLISLFPREIEVRTTEMSIGT